MTEVDVTIYLKILYTMRLTNVQKAKLPQRDFFVNNVKIVYNVNMTDLYI